MVPRLVFDPLGIDPHRVHRNQLAGSAQNEAVESRLGLGDRRQEREHELRLLPGNHFYRRDLPHHPLHNRRARRFELQVRQLPASEVIALELHIQLQKTARAGGDYRSSGAVAEGIRSRPEAPAVLVVRGARLLRQQQVLVLLPRQRPALRVAVRDLGAPPGAAPVAVRVAVRPAASANLHPGARVPVPRPADPPHAGHRLEVENPGSEKGVRRIAVAVDLELGDLPRTRAAPEVPVRAVRIADLQHDGVHEPGRHGHLDARCSVVLCLRHQIEVPQAAEGIVETRTVAAKDIEPQKLGKTILMFRRRIEHHPVDRQDAPQVNPQEGPFTGFLYVGFFERRSGVPVDRQVVKFMVGFYRPLGTEGASPQAGGIQCDVAVRFQQHRSKPPFVHVHDLPPAAETRGCILP